jgi:hypothetical protein
MVDYGEIKETFRDYLEDERRHLYDISGVKVMFWSTLGNSWRIVTDLPVEVAEGVARSLNDGLRQGVRRFEAHEAWHDINPKYKTPRMHSEMVGELPDPASVDRLWAAISMVSSGRDVTNYAGSRWRRRISRGVKIPEPPEGRSLDEILGRLERGDEGISYQEGKGGGGGGDLEAVVITHADAGAAPRVRGVDEGAPERDKDEMITELRARGRTYGEIADTVESQRGEVVSRSYIYKVLKDAGLVESRD